MAMALAAYVGTWVTLTSNIYCSGNTDIDRMQIKKFWHPTEECQSFKLPIFCGPLLLEN